MMAASEFDDDEVKAAGIVLAIAATIFCGGLGIVLGGLGGLLAGASLPWVAMAVYVMEGSRRERRAKDSGEAKKKERTRKMPGATEPPKARP